MSAVVFDRVPDNFRAKLGSAVVTGDIYRIADQLDELSISAYGQPGHLILTDRAGEGWPEDGGFRYVVSEQCDDGALRWVAGINHGELDSRVLTKLRYMLSVPFEKRFSKAEADEARIKAAQEEEELDRMAAEMGEPMLRDLERCGFIQRPKSYAKRGVSGPRRGAGRPRDIIIP